MDYIKKHVIAISLVAIVLLGGFLRFYRLGNTAFDRDEFFELNSSYGYFKTGSFTAWDFGNEKPFSLDMQDDSSNERAEVFRWQLAQLYRFHEPTEFLARSLGAAWGVIAVLLVYLITASMTGNRWAGLLAALLTAIGESEIIYSRRLRMYAMFFPAYLAFSWTVFRFYESRYQGKIKIFRWMAKKIGFDPAYLLPLLVLGVISLNVHVLTVNIAVTIGAYAFLWWLVDVLRKHKLSLDRYSLTVAALAVGLLATRLPLLAPVYKMIKKNIQFFRHNYDFFVEFFKDHSIIWIGMGLMLFGAWYLAKKMDRPKEASFLAISGFLPLALAIFTWKRDVSQRYIYFLQSFGVILSAVGIFGLAQLAYEQAKSYKKIVAAAVVLIFIFSLNFEYLFSGKDGIYYGIYRAKTSSYYPDFRKVFDFVEKNKQPGEVMVTRSYRSFYWRGDKAKVYDIKSMAMGSSGCEKKLQSIVNESPSGWVVFPKVDKLNVCSAGRRFFEERMEKVQSKEIPSAVLIYRWNYR